MNQISALPNPLEILFQEYNQGRIESVGFRSFTLHAGESNSYRTLKSALIVPVSGRAIFSFEHEPLHCQARTIPARMSRQDPDHFGLGRAGFPLYQYVLRKRPAFAVLPQAQKSGTDLFHFEQILKLHPDADIRSQYQQEKLTEEFFAQIFADFQPEETYNESQIMSILLDFIAEHYAEPLTLDELAEQVNEKAGHVSYLFISTKHPPHRLPHQLSCTNSH